jgi:hypothetical protein
MNHEAGHVALMRVKKLKGIYGIGGRIISERI